MRDNRRSEGTAPAANSPKIPDSSPAAPTHQHSCTLNDAESHGICRCACGATAINTMGEAEWSEPAAAPAPGGETTPTDAELLDEMFAFYSLHKTPQGELKIPFTMSGRATLQALHDGDAPIPWNAAMQGEDSREETTNGHR